MPQQQCSTSRLRAALGGALLVAAVATGAPAEAETEPARPAATTIVPGRDVAAHRASLEGLVAEAQLPAADGAPMSLRVDVRESREMPDGRWLVVLSAQPVRGAAERATMPGRVMEAAATGGSPADAVERAFAELIDGEDAPLRLEMRWLAQQPAVTNAETVAVESIFAVEGALSAGDEAVLRRLLGVDDGVPMVGLRVGEPPEELANRLRENFVRMQGLELRWRVEHDGVRVTLSPGQAEPLPQRREVPTRRVR